MKELLIKGIDEKIYFDILDNGMPVYMWVNKKVNNFYITLNVKYGSVDTEFKLKGDKNYTQVTNGIAHFLEHVNFNIDGKTTAHDIFEKLGSSINAFTTFNFTSYEVFASTEFEKNLTYLLDYVQKPYFTKTLVEKEKGIICEEVKMGKNKPGHKLYYGMNKALFKKDKRRNLITGEVEEVRKITAEELQLVFDNFYHPQNMFVVITGNFNPYEALGIIKENQAKKEFLEYLKPIKKKVKEPVKVEQEYLEIETNVEIPKVKMCYKMPKSIFGNIEKLNLSVHLGAILRNNFGNTSVLKEELMEKELVTSIGAGKIIDDDLVVIEINFETKYPSLVLPIIKEKMENLTLTEEDLKRRRRANIAALINDYDDIEYINTDIVDQIVMEGKINDNMYDIYNKTSMKVVNSILENLDLSNHSTVMLMPFKE